MAQCYVKAIKKIQPNGPYNLSGWSLGGNIAYEMAQQMTAHGDKVNNLILIDAFAGNKFPVHQADENEDKEKEELSANVNFLQIGNMPSDEWLQHVNAVIDNRRDLIRKYQPKKYYGKITLIKAAEGGVESWKLLPDYDSNGWLEYASQLKIYISPGNHDNMVLEPHVKQLSPLITKTLSSDEK